MKKPKIIKMITILFTYRDTDITRVKNSLLGSQNQSTYSCLNFPIANFESGGVSGNVKLAEIEREKYLKSMFSDEFYNLLKDFNSLNIKYNYVKFKILNRLG